MTNPPRVRLPTLAITTLLPLLLGSCGSVVGALVPPQSVTNPAGLSGATLAPSSALTTESVKGTVDYSTEATTPKSSFDDIKYPDNIPFGIRPHALKFNSSIAAARVSGLCTLPVSFTLTLKTVRVTVKDAHGSASINAAPNVTVTLTRNGGAITGQADYTATGNTLSFSADAATTDAALTVLTTGGINDASLNAAISASDNSLAGCQMSLTLGDAVLVLSNFS